MLSSLKLRGLISLVGLSILISPLTLHAAGGAAIGKSIGKFIKTVPWDEMIDALKTALKSVDLSAPKKPKIKNIIKDVLATSSQFNDKTLNYDSDHGVSRFFKVVSNYMKSSHHYYGTFGQYCDFLSDEKNLSAASQLTGRGNRRIIRTLLNEAGFDPLQLKRPLQNQDFFDTLDYYVLGQSERAKRLYSKLKYSEVHREEFRKPRNNDWFGQLESSEKVKTFRANSIYSGSVSHNRRLVDTLDQRPLDQKFGLDVLAFVPRSAVGYNDVFGLMPSRAKINQMGRLQGEFESYTNAFICCDSDTSSGNLISGEIYRVDSYDEDFLRSQSSSRFERLSEVISQFPVSPNPLIIVGHSEKAEVGRVLKIPGVGEFDIDSLRSIIEEILSRKCIVITCYGDDLKDNRAISFESAKKLCKFAVDITNSGDVKNFRELIIAMRKNRLTQRIQRIALSAAGIGTSGAVVVITWDQKRRSMINDNYLFPSTTIKIPVFHIGVEDPQISF